MFDYKLKSQNETVTIYEYKGTISKTNQSSVDEFSVRNMLRIRVQRTLVKHE